MANPQPNASTVSNLLTTHRALLDTVTSFLTVVTHHILFLRQLYPPISFLSARAYNFPVRQNRHPQVCRWINDAVAAIRDQLEKNTVEKICLCIYECSESRVLERWTIDLRSFPSVAKRDRDVPFEDNTSDADDSNTAGAAEADLSRKVNLADLEASFRAMLSRISSSAAKLSPLPHGPGAPECSFTLTIEVKDAADRPVGRLEREERKWIAAEPDSFEEEENLFEGGRTSNVVSKTHPRTHPVRRLEAGELRMEVWVEESAAKFNYPSSYPVSAAEAAAKRRNKTSFGAGKDKFAPDGMHGDYDLEPPDLHRKPQGGAGTDYQRG
ncbi:hypothetical protein B0A52_08180 [Exophiala mesophila]|uniref:HORMA domain-containing protein n=1 Tax=Exophiala mesophila TaxID=212818 RepID=A0A438MV72_EXOME|nr:hypothetical protein B0A52_08180 [Exophiala mesophila]